MNDKDVIGFLKDFFATGGEKKWNDEKLMNEHVDEALWEKGKDASKKAFGRVKWPFVMYFYKKQGGK